MFPLADLPDRTLEHLEWSRLTDAVLTRCRGESTRRRGVPLTGDVEEARTWLAASGEAMGLIEEDAPLPLGDLRDVEPHLGRLSRDGVLDAPALADLRVTLRTAGAVRRFMSQRKGELSALRAAAHLDPSLDDLEETLGRAVDLDGILHDDASDDLKRLRSEVGNLRSRIIGKLGGLIDKHRSVLQDNFYTLREGRYVLPVRTDAHEKVQGIVHGTSATGATVFVEPRAIVNQGNRLKIAAAEAEREELRIAVELSAQVAEHQAELGACVHSLEQLDLHHAAALLGRDLDARAPMLDEAPEMNLRRARHPLLALEGADVIANDVALGAGQGLVLSGPNAGGKTVLLKTMGLCALMVRAGLPIPVGEGSTIGMFDRVLVDMGDSQSTFSNLSTFSAHIRGISAILSEAAPGALVLLDELAGGTDPEEGAALACAVCEALCGAGAALVVTTHYEPLKAFSLSDPRLRTASLGFDMASMEPSFKLIMDVPGRSSALAVAERFGIPHDIVESARRVLPDQTREFEQLVQDLTRRAQQLQTRQTELEEEKAQLSAERSTLQAKLHAIRQRGAERVDREALALLDAIRDTRAKVDSARTRIDAIELTQQDLSEASRTVDEAASRVALGGDLAPRAAQPEERPPLDAGALEVGARVHVPNLRADGQVLEADGRGKVRVAVGALKLWVEAAHLRAPGDPISAGRAAPTATTQSAPRDSPAERSMDNTVNVRGMRVDEAIAQVERFADQLCTTDSPVGYVLHGHGTGALRDAIRRHLETAMPHIASAKPADADEGGDAVTVFTLR